MTWLQRKIRNLLERWLGRYHEGPDTPPRILQEVRIFQLMHPEASADEWAQMARRLVDSSYKAGFTRGLEWNERCWPGPVEDPEVIAERKAYEHSLPDAYFAQLRAQPSPIQGLSALEASRLQHQLGHAGARIILLDTDGNPLARKP